MMRMRMKMRRRRRSRQVQWRSIGEAIGDAKGQQDPQEMKGPMLATAIALFDGWEWSLRISDLRNYYCYPSARMTKRLFS